MEPKTLIELLAKRGPVISGIGLALPYLKTIERVVSGAKGGSLSPRDLSLYSGHTWQTALKDAESKCVYKNGNMVVLKKSDAKTDDGSPQPIAMFDCVMTSGKKDRDEDVLHPEGADLDSRMPLLWQHNPVEPIGRLFNVIKQDKDDVRGSVGIADIPLGRDAAYLVEFGALRISHGFKPKRFEPIKSGDIITGFEVFEYEMMEVSLVSVPSNTDAVITAFSRNKLTSGVAKSWGCNLYKNRRLVVAGGWGGVKNSLTRIANVKTAKPTGKKRASVKEGDDFEDMLAAAASTIVHSNDYGYCFYGKGDEEGQFKVAWTMGNADAGGQTDDGTPYTTEEDIKSILGNVTGVTSVECMSETAPPKGEGWRMVYPDKKDWVEDNQSSDATGSGSGDANGDGSGSGTDGSQQNDDGKGKKPSPKTAIGIPTSGKDGPVQGSFEHIANALREMASGYLANNGVQIDPEKDFVFVAATYADSVVLCVLRREGESEYYQVTYSVTDGEPAFTGKPVPVELKVVLVPLNEGEAKPAEGGDQQGGATAPSDAQPDQAHTHPAFKFCWTLRKGKLTRKDTGVLNEALEHFNEALGANKMPTTIKTLVQRGTDLVSDVVKGNGDGSDSGDGDMTDQPDGEPKSLWLTLRKEVARGNFKHKRLAIALMAEQYALALRNAEVADDFADMGIES